MSDLTKSKSVAVTNNCYKQARANLGIKIDDIHYNREILGKEYIRLVRRLPSIILELIVQEYVDDIMNREEHTIQEILSELANRILIEGENETCNER